MSNESYILSHQDGCLIHNTCLTCPLKVCIFDKEKEEQIIEQEVDIISQILEDYRFHDKKWIAKKYNYSERRIQEIIKEKFNK